MNVFRRRRSVAARWPWLLAAVTAGAAAYVAWSLFLRGGDLTDDQVREIEAFEEYERRKRASAG
jgi:hypothetical protein